MAYCKGLTKESKKIGKHWFRNKPTLDYHKSDWWVEESERFIDRVKEKAKKRRGYAGATKFPGQARKP